MESPKDKNRTTLIRAGTILTMTGAPISDGAIFIRDGRIESIGPYDLVRRNLGGEPAQSEIGSGSHIAMPGMIDAHQHGRGVSQVQAGVRDGPLEPLQFRRLASRVPDVDPYSDTLYSCLSLLESGVTTLVHAPIVRDPMGEDVRGELEQVFQAYLDSGVRALYCVAISDQHSFVYADDKSFLDSLPESARNLGYALQESKRGLHLGEYFDFVDMLDVRANELSNGRVRVALGPMGPQWCSDDLLKGLRDHASETGRLIHTHCLETVFQREYGYRVYGQGVVQHLAKIGFLGSDVTLAHCVWLSEPEIEILADTATRVVHNPSSNLRLRSGIAPILPLTRAGVIVGLGSDSLCWNDDHDFFQEIRAAFRLHRLQGLGPDELTANDVLTMATGLGAETAGWGNDIGRLTIGGRADVVLVDGGDLDIPFVNNNLPPEEYLVNRCRASYVDTVLIDGEVVVEGGQHPHRNRDYVAQELLRTTKEGATQGRADLVRQGSPLVHDFYDSWTIGADEPFYVFNGKRRERRG